MTLKGHPLQQLVCPSRDFLWRLGTKAAPETIDATEFFLRVSLLDNFQLAPTGPCYVLCNYTRNSPFIIVENPFSGCKVSCRDVMYNRACTQ